MKKFRFRKIKDKIIFANTMSLFVISFIIILSMTIFLVQTAVEAEMGEMDKLMVAVIEKMEKVPFSKLKGEYENYDYADKQHISVAVKEGNDLTFLTNDINQGDIKNFDTNKLLIHFDRFFYRRIYEDTRGGRTYYTVRNFNFHEAHEIIYIMLLMFLLITISIYIISKVVTGYVLNPLLKIIRQSREMSKHNIDTKFIKTRNDEIGELVDVLNETFEKKEKIIQSQKKFSADISHELKTPLAIMKGYLDILKWGKDDENLLNEAIENMDIEVKNMEKVINNLFLSSNLEKINIQREKIDVKKFLEKIEKDYLLLHSDRILVVNSQENVEINGDSYLLYETLRGIIDNSIKYSEGKVELMAFREKGKGSEREKTTIIIRDYGKGIEEEKLNKVFDRYYKKSEVKSSTGLGLNIIRDIINLNDGKITLKNREDGLDVILEF